MMSPRTEGRVVLSACFERAKVSGAAYEIKAPRCTFLKKRAGQKNVKIN
jgi:hypothetical protein